MLQALFLFGSNFYGTSLLLIDWGVKGAAVLGLALVVTLALRRDSAAVRHWVWLVAIVASLVLPLLSIALPQWRVLPTWAALPGEISTKNETAGMESVVSEMHGCRHRCLSHDDRSKQLDVDIRIGSSRQVKATIDVDDTIECGFSKSEHLRFGGSRYA
jgi:hypothetical protein